MKLLLFRILKTTAMGYCVKRRYFLLHRQMGSYVSLLAYAPEEMLSVVVLGYCDIDPYEEHLLNQEAGRLDDECELRLQMIKSALQKSKRYFQSGIHIKEE